MEMAVGQNQIWESRKDKADGESHPSPSLPSFLQWFRFVDHLKHALFEVYRHRRQQCYLAKCFSFDSVFLTGHVSQEEVEGFI